MVIIKKRVRGGTISSDVENLQVNESLKINAPATRLTLPTFSPSGLTVQTTPEWYESLRQTVDFIVDQRLEQNMPVIAKMIDSVLEVKLREINETISQDGSSSNNELEIMNKILEQSRDYLIQNYKGKFVGLTFEGKVVASSTSQVDLLNQIDRLEIPKEQIFVYSVPLS